MLAQCFRRTTLRFLFRNSTLNAEQLASGLRVQDLLMGKVPCDVGVVCEFLWFIISFLMKMTILRYSILQVIDLFETVATFIRASACFADPFLPKQWPPVTGVQRVSEKPCTLYITVHGVTTSAILNKHICGLWIISTGLTILRGHLKGLHPGSAFWPSRNRASTQRHCAAQRTSRLPPLSCAGCSGGQDATARLICGRPC